MTDIEKNKKLVKKYPWLLPRNVFTDEIVSDYDYSWTEFDNIPEGWAYAFGMNLVKEIHAELVKHNLVEKFRIHQIKEKYGSLCFYTNFTTPEIDKIVSRYQKMRAVTCIQCGKPAKFVTTGWILPYCEDCIGHDECHSIDDFPIL